MLVDSSIILQAFKARINPHNEWFTNHQKEVVDCIKIPPENIKVVWGKMETEEKAEGLANRTDAVCNILDRGSEWRGSMDTRQFNRS